MKIWKILKKVVEMFAVFVAIIAVIILSTWIGAVFSYFTNSREYPD